MSIIHLQYGEQFRNTRRMSEKESCIEEMTESTSASEVNCQSVSIYNIMKVFWYYN